MTDGHRRRQFLGIAGTGAAASLAGCSQLESLMQSDDGSSDAVTVAVSPDQEDLEQLNEEIQTAVQSGNLSQQEAQQQAIEEQRNLTEEAASDFEESVGSEITVEESAPEFGLLRVTGSDEAIMSALRNGEISGIYPGDQYDAFVQQQQQQAEQQEMLWQQQEQQAQQENGTANESDSGTELNESDSGNETDTENGTDESDGGNESA